MGPTPPTGPPSSAAASAPARHTVRSDLRRVLLVAERELVEYARQRSFRNGTAATALMLVAAVAAVSLWPRLFGGPDEVRLGVLPEATALAATLSELADPDELTIDTRPVADGDAAEEALLTGAVDAVLAGERTVVVVDGLDPVLGSWIQLAMDTTRLAALLDVGAGEALMSVSAPLQLEELDPTDPAARQRRVMTLIGVWLAFGQVLGGAYVLANGLVVEKTSRVVELLVAKAHPRLLLAGKLIGLFCVLTAQLVVFVAVGLTAVAISPDLTVPEGLPAAIGAILFWYVLAFAIFGALFSIAGALSAREEDMATKMQPMLYLVFAAFAAAFFASGNPDHPVSLVATYVPFTAPAVLPARLVIGEVAWWEITLATAITLAAASLAVRFAGRVYSGGALRTRGSTTVREALRGTGG